MHQSFTGSTRRARQVNLSGRVAANPWAKPSGSGTTSATGGANAPLAHAQADRARRQQDRDRLNAANKLQRVWRSHASRQQQKKRWREEWDMRERQRLGELDSTAYEDLISRMQGSESYPTEEVLLRQLRLLAFFLDVWKQNDVFRLLHFGSAFSGVTRNCPSVSPDVKWEGHITKLRLQLSKAIYADGAKHKGKLTLTRNLLGLLQIFDEISPIRSDGTASSTFTSIVHLLEHSPDIEHTQTEAALIAYQSMLAPGQRLIYNAFAVEVLGNSVLSMKEVILNRLTSSLDLGLLAQSIIEKRDDMRTAAANGAHLELWCLSYLTYFFLKSSLVAGKAAATTALVVQATSVLLGDCANLIQAQFEHNGQEPNFLHQCLEQLCTEHSVRNIISTLGQHSEASLRYQERFIPAKQLANYAVALLQAFPTRSMDIRMWLFSGSMAITSTTNLSTIQYFWQAARNTAVFGRIVQDQRQVLSILREAVPQSNQLNQAPTAREVIKEWQDDWRLIMLFLELYTFILKLMDDEEFFAMSEAHLRQRFSSLPGTDRSNYRNSLPLKEVADMTTFLKNLAFTLYWNAAVLADSNELEESGGISALFGTSVTQSSRVATKHKRSTLAGNDVSQAYLKGLTTGLLRMLHERDSRRKFLSEGHWLMTSQFDMSGFIPAVVEEEERRQELGDDPDDEDDEEIMDDFTDPSRIGADVQNGTGQGSSVNLLSSVFGIRPAHTTQGHSALQAEANAKRREQARKQRQLESLAPRLEILRNLPFFIPFDTRVQIFRGFIYRDQMRRRGGYADPDHWRMAVARNSMGRALDGQPQGLDALHRWRAEIRRDRVVEDAYDQFYELGEALKEPIQISFIDRFGQPEAGIDGGGVTKEFLMSVTSDFLDPDRHDFRYFVENSQHCLYPNPTAFEQTNEHLLSAKSFKSGKDGELEYKKQLRDLLQYYEFMGRIIGKCLYEGILVDATFAGFFLLKWALTGGTTSASKETAYRPTINDVREYDEELYQGLLKLKNWTGDVETDFGLDFELTNVIEFTDRAGKRIRQSKTVSLAPNRSKVPVTNSNRLAYINAVVRYRLQLQPKLVTDAFLRGLGQMIQPMWLSMFNQKELQKVVGGDSAEVDITDLRRNTIYGGLYVVGDDGLEHPTVRLFWSVLAKMSDQDRRKVIKFVTSTPRAPLLGFGHLNPKFSIRDSSEDQERLPSTSTCVNLLKLPRYGDEKTMMEKLLYAVNSGAGFDLS